MRVPHVDATGGFGGPAAENMLLTAAARESIGEVLADVRQRLGMDVALVSRFTGVSASSSWSTEPAAQGSGPGRATPSTRPTATAAWRAGFRR